VHTPRPPGEGGRWSTLRLSIWDPSSGLGSRSDLGPDVGGNISSHKKEKPRPANGKGLTLEALKSPASPIITKFGFRDVGKPRR
jgi:hypothetical protein